MDNRQESDSAYTISRRSFFKAAAGMAAGAVFMSMPEISLAKNVEYKRVSLADCPIDPLVAAKASALVGAAYETVISTVGKISDAQLRAKVQTIIENPAPTLMEQYGAASSITLVYSRLASMGLIDTSKLSDKQLFPRYKDSQKAPQPFISAPGSGYGSHHSYPGGLSTHTATNLLSVSGLLGIYRKNFGYDISSDVVIASEALHDLHKPWVFQWEADGSCLLEMTIAGTGSHHILSLAESMYRGMPADVIVAQACAHNHPGTPKDEADVVGWIKAAAAIAGKDPLKEEFLAKDGEHVPLPQRQDGFITHLGDHDWILSVPAAQNGIIALKEIAKEVYGMSDKDLSGLPFNKFRNYAASQISFMRIHSLLGQPQALKSLVKSVIE